MGWLGAVATHGISETHVAHHVASCIPHYHAWEASAALRRLLAKHGISLQGRPGGWAEVYRVFRECKFVEDEGDIVFYKNKQGVQQRFLAEDTVAKIQQSGWSQEQQDALPEGVSSDSKAD